MEKGESPSKIVKELGVTQVSDLGQIEKLVEEAIENNPKALADFRSGKESSLQFLFGQVMRSSQGRANPGLIRELLEKKLKE